MTIEEAAELLVSDPRRTDARLVSHIVSRHSAEIMVEYCAFFRPEYSSVSGSTSRDTHLPTSPDFDLGLWSAECGSSAVIMQPLRRPILQHQHIVRDYAIKLGEQLAADKRLSEKLASLYNCSADEIKSVFRSEPRLSIRTDQVTAKFAVGDRSLIEVALGHHPWHYIGLRYNFYWAEQLGQLSEDIKRKTIGQIWH
ncbi:MAG: hypothetical protein FJ010_14620 [Chloroflexi bacterium]|nr:hypothetical protein [Chloroflexota bacterium]